MACCDKTCGLARLIRGHPELVNATTLKYPRKSVALMLNADVAVMNALLDITPKRVLLPVLTALFTEVSANDLAGKVAPLMSRADYHQPMLACMELLRPEHMALLVNEVPVENLQCVMAVPGPKLRQLMGNILPARVAPALVPILLEPRSLIADRLVPVLMRCRHPGRVGLMVNYIELSMLLPIMRGVEPERIASLADLVEDKDVEPGGAVIVLMGLLNREPYLLTEKVLPLMAVATISKLVPFMLRVKADAMLQLLRSNEPQVLALLVEHTDVAVAEKATGTALGAMVAALAAEHLTAAMGGHSGQRAQAVEFATSQLGRGLSHAEDVVKAGKRARGGGSQDDYQFGDFTKGLLSKVATKMQGTEAATSVPDPPLLDTEDGCIATEMTGVGKVDGASEKTEPVTSTDRART